MSMKAKPQFSEVNYPKKTGILPGWRAQFLLAAGSLRVGVLIGLILGWDVAGSF